MLRKNILYQIAYQVIGVILPFITAPYVARVLGVENSGIYSFTMAIASYFVLFGMLGIEQYGSRCIAKARDNYDKRSTVFSELLLLHIIVSLLTIICYFIYCGIFARQYRDIYLIQGLYVCSTLFDINWFFFGIERFKHTVTKNAIIKICTVAATFLFVKAKDDFYLYTAILSASALLSQIVIWPALNRYVKIKYIPFSSIIKHLKPLLLIFLAVVSANLNRMIDKVMLGMYGIMSGLGCYDYADKIIRIPLGLIAALGTVMLSRMSNLNAGDEKEKAKGLLDISACIIMFLSVGMGFGLAAVAPEFILWYLGEEYKGAIVLLQILSISIPIVGWNNYVRTQILIPKELDGMYTKAVTGGAVVNIVLNSLFITQMGATGAAIATICSYTVIMFLQTIPIMKTTGAQKYLKYALCPIILGATMYIVIRLCSILPLRLPLIVFIELIVGGILYSCLSFIYLKFKHPRILNLLLRKTRK